MRKSIAHDSRFRRQAVLLSCALAASVAVCACNKNRETRPAVADTKPATGLSAEREGEQIIERNRALDASKDSTTKTRAKIQEDAGTSREVQMTIYRKRDAAGRILMLVTFTAPSQERDRNALVIVGPKGELEATRYVQSNDSFVTSTSATGEDSLFGMSLQELADGQLEKYNYRLTGEETVGSSPAYRVEGKLKQGAESKFPRLVLLISKDNGAALAAEFYDNQNELERRVTVDKLEQINGYWTRLRWLVDNKARQKKIDFEVTEVKYDQKLSDSIFTRDNLKKVSSK